MTNAQIIEKLSANLIRTIAHRMVELDETYEQAKAVAKESSCAGVAVWQAVDKQFGHQ